MAKLKRAGAEDNLVMGPRGNTMATITTADAEHIQIKGLQREEHDDNKETARRIY